MYPLQLNEALLGLNVLIVKLSTTCLTPKNQRRAYVEFQFIIINYKVIVNHFSIKFHNVMPHVHSLY